MSSAIVEAEVVTFDAVTKNHKKKRTITILGPERCFIDLAEKSVDHLGRLDEGDWGDVRVKEVAA
jgi:hypothetical protein